MVAALSVAVVVAAIGLALAFKSVSGARRVADNARDLHWTDAARASAALLRAANAQVVYFAVDYAAGGASADAVERAITEAERVLAACESSGSGRIRNPS